MYENGSYALEVGDALAYRLKATGEVIPLAFPQFQINGEDSGIPAGFRETGRRRLTEEISEWTYSGTYPCGAELELILRVCGKSPVLRFRYVLSARQPLCLTKAGGTDDVTYFAYPSEAGAPRTEVRLSDYDFRLHSYCLSELPAFSREEDAMGPILVEQRGETCLFTAYEHGSQYPDKFLAFRPGDGCIELRAVKGNTWDGQRLDQRPYETIWFQLGAVRGTETELSRTYREFQLRYCTLNAASREPYIFYNTWAFQERNKYYNGCAYLDSMNFDRISAEIDEAHRMGVDVFVIDTGWYRKTGDWETDLARFPDGLQEIRRKLEGYGMKMGLWFNPTVAAVTSRLLKGHREAVASRRGEEPQAFPIWETEESHLMCLVSDYWESFADELIRLYGELGVTYFKWDGVDLYGCESGEHFHGGPESSGEECGDCYAFQMGRYMSQIVDKLCGACPEAIVDMDITECRRYFGLGFLSSGKYFAVNNGPYFHDLDISVPDTVWSNAFVHPGLARPRICRGVLDYDRWFPSVLMMTHYLPDDPEGSQLVNLASLILGQNGIWGDLPAVSSQGKELFHRVLKAYKQVREDITAAYPATLGHPGSTFEVHEKVCGETGRGAVALFAEYPGQYRYRMENPPADRETVFGNARVLRERESVWIEVEFTQPGAAIVLFGCGED